MGWPNKYGETINLNSTTAASTFSLANASGINVTLTADTTLAAPTNMVAGKEYTYTVTQDATGGRLLAFASIYDGVTDVTTGLPNETRDLTFRYIGGVMRLTHDTGWNLGVISYANKAAFPTRTNARFDKLYFAKDTGITYRFTGSDLYELGEYIPEDSPSTTSGVELTSYFTAAEVTAMRRNNWAGIDLAVLNDKFENALSAHCWSGEQLRVNGILFFKAIRPIRYVGRLNFYCTGTCAGGYGFNLYPDLSVNWANRQGGTPLYLDRGVFETANFDFPTLPPNKPAWSNNKPDFSPSCYIRGIHIQAAGDTANYPANAENMPDYGFVAHCLNEAWVFDACYADTFRKNGFLFSGLQSTPTLYNCGAMSTGTATNTIFGANVTRAASAFAKPVTVYNNMTVASPVVILESECDVDSGAGVSASLNSIANGNVLTIDSIDYTVMQVGAVITSPSKMATPLNIKEQTRIAGVVTNYRVILTVTLSASLPQYTKGRSFPYGLGMKPHPKGADFAVGHNSAAGGQGTAGLINTVNFSGDYSFCSLVGVQGIGTIGLVGLKSENNRHVAHIDTASTGGNLAKIIFSGGYRFDGAAATSNLSAVRIVGGSGRASISSCGGYANSAAYPTFVEDFSNSPNYDVAAVSNISSGITGLSYSNLGTEYSFSDYIVSQRVEVKGWNAQLRLSGKHNANCNMQWDLANTGTPYMLRVGATGNLRAIMTIAGTADPSTITYNRWSGSAMIPAITLTSAGIGFNGAAAAYPIVPSAGVTAAQLHAALLALGLIKES